MNEEKKSDRAALDRLASALIEDILDASDEDILNEVREDQGDPAAIAAHGRRLFDVAVAGVAKSRLAAAKAAVLADRRRAHSTVTPLDPTTARAHLQAILDRDPETCKKLTLAARKGEGLSDEDVQGMLEDLEELGITPESDRQDDD